MATSVLNLDSRISRLLGQLRGISKMAKEQRDCVEILQQISAVKKAINGLTHEILMSYFDEEMTTKKRNELETVMERVIDL